MTRSSLFAAGVVLAAGLAGCASLTGRDEISADFDRQANADDARMLEDKSRTNLSTIEAALADYLKAENKIPPKLDALVPKYLAAIPPLNIPVCGGETERIENYPTDILRDGQVDGSRIRGTGRWGYVHNDDRVVVFVDCLKPSLRGTPWYQERGVY